MGSGRGKVRRVRYETPAEDDAETRRAQLLSLWRKFINDQELQGVRVQDYYDDAPLACPVAAAEHLANDLLQDLLSLSPGALPAGREAKKVRYVLEDYRNAQKGPPATLEDANLKITYGDSGVFVTTVFVVNNGILSDFARASFDSKEVKRLLLDTLRNIDYLFHLLKKVENGEKIDPANLG